MVLAQLNTCVLQQCRESAQLMELGQYEEARQALGSLWRGTGVTPELDGLPPDAAGEVLLQCGALTGWLGTVKQMEAQERAKDLLTKAGRIFESTGDRQKLAEVGYELGICYWRAGGFSEARLILKDALHGLEDTELRTKILIRRTLPEISEGRYHDAWKILRQADIEPCSDVIKGKWHGQLALVLRRLSTAENRTDYADRAIIEFTAAIYHYEQAGHTRYCATNLNNLAILLHKLGRYSEAHDNLDRARVFLLKVHDAGLLAQVDETRSQVLLAEHRYQEAHAVINEVVVTLKRGGEQALLADALSIQATIQARLNMTDSSLATFRHALKTAQDAGANTSAGLAALSLIEEHHSCLTEFEVFQTYDRADALLSDTQDAEHVARLRNCARILVRRTASTADLPLPEAILIHEARYIEQALQREKGSITRAAKRLGLTHQGLAYILKARHKELLSKRTPIINRRATAFRTRKVRRGSAKLS